MSKERKVIIAYDRKIVIQSRIVPLLGDVRLMPNGRVLFPGQEAEPDFMRVPNTRRQGKNKAKR